MSSSFDQLFYRYSEDPAIYAFELFENNYQDYEDDKHPLSDFLQSQILTPHTKESVQNLYLVVGTEDEFNLLWNSLFKENKENVLLTTMDVISKIEEKIGTNIEKRNQVLMVHRDALIKQNEF